MMAALACFRCGGSFLRPNAGETEKGRYIAVLSCRCGAWTRTAMSPKDSAMILADRELEVIDQREAAA